MSATLERPVPARHGQVVAQEPIPPPDEALDVRLYAPSLHAVIVRVEGSLSRSTAPMLALRLRQQFRRAPHVVLDLSSVDHVDADAADELRRVCAAADRCGTRVHVAGAGAEAVAEPLRRTDPTWRLVAGPADAVLATLAEWNAAGTHGRSGRVSPLPGAPGRPVGTGVNAP